MKCIGISICGLSLVIVIVVRIIFIAITNNNSNNNMNYLATIIIFKPLVFFHACAFNYLRPVWNLLSNLTTR